MILDSPDISALSVDAQRARLVLSVALPRLIRSADSVKRWLDDWQPGALRAAAAQLRNIPGAEALAVLARLSQDERCHLADELTQGDDADTLRALATRLGDIADPSSPAAALIRIFPDAAELDGELEAPEQKTLPWSQQDQKALEACYLELHQQMTPQEVVLVVGSVLLRSVLQNEKAEEIWESRHRIEQVMKVIEEVLNSDHLMMAVPYAHLATVELSEGNRAAACDLWRRSHARLTKNFPPTHPQVQAVARALEEHCGGVAEVEEG